MDSPDVPPQEGKIGTRIGATMGWLLWGTHGGPRKGGGKKRGNLVAMGCPVVACRLSLIRCIALASGSGVSIEAMGGGGDDATAQVVADAEATLERNALTLKSVFGLNCAVPDALHAVSYELPDDPTGKTVHSMFYTAAHTGTFFFFFFFFLCSWFVVVRLRLFALPSFLRLSISHLPARWCRRLPVHLLLSTPPSPLFTSFHSPNRRTSQAWWRTLRLVPSACCRAIDRK